ncbi:MAG: URC4/urg3 family protein [Alphaproteobacteria bacterium]|nr:URC4/urg3 family protein [Alphaproteobacteria bacterium]
MRSSRWTPRRRPGTTATAARQTPATSPPSRDGRSAITKVVEGNRDTVAWLRSAAAVRQRCDAILRTGLRGELDFFDIDPTRMAATAAYVAETTRLAYPDLDVPPHSRWRHFTAGGVDRWSRIAGEIESASADETARVKFDLVVTSVLLDAGAGAEWRYREADTGDSYARSEGLAVASFDLFAAGRLSADPGNLYRADAAALGHFGAEDIARGFQVDAGNPLVGLDGRAGLLRRLGAALEARPGMFGRDRPRVGNLFDYLAAQAPDGTLPAEVILAAILQGLGPIWPGRIVVDGENLGDVWRHPAVSAADPTGGLVPFHKLSQWLAYSLIEPLQAAGIAITGQDALTGLPEYRNGGLLIDMGVLVPKQPEVLEEAHDVGSVVVVEWRALTVALLDRLADEVRAVLGLAPAAFPLAKVLEGGTWAAGRRIAAERRPDGGSPLKVRSDGTVF